MPEFVHNVHNGWNYDLAHFDEDGNAHLIHRSMKRVGTLVVSNENFRAHFRRGHTMLMEN